MQEILRCKAECIKCKWTEYDWFPSALRWRKGILRIYKNVPLSVIDTLLSGKRSWQSECSFLVWIVRCAADRQVLSVGCLLSDICKTGWDRHSGNCLCWVERVLRNLLFKDRKQENMNDTWRKIVLMVNGLVLFYSKHFVTVILTRPFIQVLYFLCWSTFNWTCTQSNSHGLIRGQLKGQYIPQEYFRVESPTSQ